MKKIFLSYSLSLSTPSYGNSDPMQIQKTKDMTCGDSCNQIRFTMSNHLGTHIDCPNHFDAEGKTIDQYSADFWFFEKIAFLEVSAAPGELINIEKYAKAVPLDAEALLIKTGFCHRRHEPVYWKNNPGFSAESGEYLRARFPRLRLIGFDLISLTSYSQREEGRRAHRAFLKQKGSNPPIVIVEDMDLTQLSVTPSSLVVLPLRGEGFDGAPVTVIAEI